MDIIAMIPLAVLGIFVIVNVLVGLFSGLRKSLARLIALIASALIAFVATLIVCSPSAELISTVLNIVTDLFAGTALEALLAVDALGISISYYISMLIAPFFFMVAFIALSIVLSIVAAIVVRLIFRKKTGFVRNRLGGMLIGLVCGVLITFIILTPIIGTINLASPVLELDAIKESFAEGEELTESEIINVFAVAGCVPLYNALASAEFEGEKVYLKNEVVALITIIDGLTSLTGDITEYGEDQIAALNTMLEGLKQSPLLKSTVAGILAEAASSWVDGESFAGLEKPEADEIIAPILDGMLGVLASSTKDTIEQDLGTMKDVFAIMIRSEILKHSSDFSEMLSQLNKTDAISALFEVVNANERMTVLSDEITNLGIRALASTIGVIEDEQERYDLLMSEIADVLNETSNKSGDERAEAVKPKLKKAFEDYGVEVSGDALVEVCRGLIADLGNKGTLEASDVKEFFVIYAVAGKQSASAAYGSGYDLLSSNIPGVKVNSNGTISVGGVVFKNYDSTSYKNSEAYNMGSLGVDIDGAASLYSAESMESTLITMADLMAAITKYGDCVDIAAESAKVSKIITRALEIFDEIDFDNVSATDLMPKLGEILDMMNDSKIFGKEMSANMLLAILQSEKIVDSIGISVAESTNFANKINEMVDDGKFDYLHATEVIADTVTVMEAAGNNTDKTKEEKKEDTQKLLDTISKDTAEMIGTLVTPSLIENYGVSTEKSDTVSSTVSSLLDNMANYENEDDVNGEQAAKEAEAVSTLLDLAITASDSNGGSLFNTKTDNGTGEGGEVSTGSLDTTAAELVELVVTSEVVSTTIDDMVYRDGNDDNPFGAQLNEQDAAEATTAIEEYYANNKGASAEADEELARKLEAIAIMLNVQVELEK